MQSNGNPRRHEELLAARNILNALLTPTNSNITFPFMKRIDGVAFELQAYDEIIKFPMWLSKIADRLERDVYPGIREFVCDFRLILVNCFLYNGVNSRMGKYGEKLELLFEQKLQLLPTDLRAKTSLQACLGCNTHEQDIIDCAFVRRRSNARLYGSSSDGGLHSSYPIKALMEELEHTPNPNGHSGLANCLYENLPGGGGGGLFDACLNNATSHQLLVARLTHWHRVRHEEELVSSWNSWWAECKEGKAGQTALRKSPEFLEAFQLMWLIDPFLGVSDALATATRLADVSSQPLGLPSFSTDQQTRQLTLLELELGLSAAPQASLALSVFISSLLNTAKERAVVLASLAALAAATESDVARPSAHVIEDEGQASLKDITVARSVNRRLHASHVNTLHTLMVAPYAVWERRLAARMALWYSVPFERRQDDPTRIERRFGITQRLFDVCGQHKSPLEKNRFHELHKHQQSYILHALVSAVLNSSENLRASLDKSADWVSSRPLVLGEDRFRRLTFFHFPEMLETDAATRTRIFQFRFPSPNMRSVHPPPIQLTSPPTVSNPEYEIVALPGPAVRAPLWMRPEISRTVQRHIAAMLEAEPTRISYSDPKKEARRLAKLSEALQLFNIDAMALANVSSKVAAKGKGKGKGNTKTEASVEKSDIMAFTIAQASDSNLLLAPFAFISARASCGSVPLSLHGKHGGSNAKPLRPVDSMTSIATSVDEYSQQGTPSVVDTDTEQENNQPPNFTMKKEGNADDDDDVIDDDKETSNSASRKMMPADSYDDYIPNGEDVQRETIKMSFKLSRHQSTEQWSIKSGQKMEVEVNAKQEKEEVEAFAEKIEDTEEVETNIFSSELGGDRIKSEENGEVEKVEQKYLKEEEEEEEGEMNEIDSETTDKMSEMPVNDKDEDEEDLSMPPDADGEFDTVAFDLLSFCGLLDDISSRLSTGRKLLSRLRTIVTEGKELIEIVDEFRRKLGGEVAERILEDESLTKLIQPLSFLQEVDKETESTSQPTVIRRKRRRQSLLCAKPKRARTSTNNKNVVDLIGEDAVPPAVRILRLHEEAVEDLVSLQAHLISLKKTVEMSEADRVIGERMTGLRLRKDIEAWEEAMKPKQKKVKPPTPVRETINTAKERADRFQDREQRRNTTTPPPVDSLQLPSSPIKGKVPISPCPNRLCLPSYAPKIVTRPDSPRSPTSAAPIYARPLSPLKPRLLPVLQPSPSKSIVIAPLVRPASTATSSTVSKKIYRFYDHLWTDEALPVKIDPNGALIYLDPESLPLQHRTNAKLMIERYHMTVTHTAITSTASNSIQPQ